jgi:hypothetical protein
MTELESKIQRFKEMAAQKAFEAYGEILAALLEKEGISLVPALDGTSHVHSALLIDHNENTIAVRCQWDFTADPRVIEVGKEMVRKEGRL